ncbi:Ras-related protein Rap [Acrasis kona]|uniref:Ras-related protein Rap n=1 Tax=Acrasis kona TaxID=1008807 RepID=A0AAW2ZP30_9EUKA
MIQGNPLEIIILSSVCRFFRRILNSDLWHFFKKNLPKINSINVLVSGEGAVGKTSLVVAYIEGRFNYDYDPTIEDRNCKRVTHDGLNLMVNMEDYNGEYDAAYFERLYREADAVLLVYSLIDNGTLEAGLTKCVLMNPHVPIFIAANKCDMDDGNTTIAESQKYADNTTKNVQGSIVRTSAKTNANVEQIFNRIVIKVFRERMKVNDLYKKVLLSLSAQNK